MSHEEAMQESAQLVRKCPSPERNCFTTDPFAYGAFINGIDEDPYYDTWFQHVGVGAMKAARANTPFAEATYSIPTLRPVAIEESSDGLAIEDVEITDDGSPENIINLAVKQDSISNMAFRIGQCAYICAQQDETTCPIFATFQEAKE